MITHSLPKHSTFNNRDRDHILAAMTYFDPMRELLEKVRLAYDGVDEKTIPSSIREVIKDSEEIEKGLDKRLWRNRA